MADKYTDDKLYKVVRKDGSHLNTKVNPDGTKSALQFTDDNNDLNGPVDLIEVDEEELIRTEYIQVPQNKRSLGELLVDEVFVPVIRDATKYKPEIVFDDALNNDIRITKNENQCLIYNRPIPPTGVMWNDLVDWYAEEKNIDENREIVFIKRLCECLDTSFKAQGAKSGPETWMLQAYYNLKKELGKDLPALIPQVYLYYDPQTLKQRGYKLFEHQKMDFLMVFSHKDRVVIEIDGRQHYAEGNSASPRLYSEMVRAQREMTLFGYDVYRFGGYEFVGADSDEKKKEAVLDDLKQFFLRLFSKYSAL
jgi:very-short-patch-repair endonuclease